MNQTAKKFIASNLSNQVIGLYDSRGRCCCCCCRRGCCYYCRCRCRCCGKVDASVAPITNWTRIHSSFCCWEYQRNAPHCPAVVHYHYHQYCCCSYDQSMSMWMTTIPTPGSKIPGMSHWKCQTIGDAVLLLLIKGSITSCYRLQTMSRLP